MRGELYVFIFETLVLLCSVLCDTRCAVCCAQYTMLCYAAVLVLRYRCVELFSFAVSCSVFAILLWRSLFLALALCLSFRPSAMYTSCVCVPFFWFSRALCADSETYSSTGFEHDFPIRALREYHFNYVYKSDCRTVHCIGRHTSTTPLYLRICVCVSICVC